MTFSLSSRMPYPGLRSFRREESDLFFGREDCINIMVDRLSATRFLAVLGSSGTGKSSVVKTGLLDALDLGAMAEARSTWRVVDFRPGSSPLRNLALRLTEAESPETGHNFSEGDVELLRAFLLRGPRSLVEWCSEGHLPENANLLLLVDQFEELFRYQDYAGREEAEAFATLLLGSARNAELPIYVTLTMRSEYLGACALIEGLAEAISAGMFLTPRMTRGQCRAAIVGPATVCGIEIEEGLVNRLLNDLAHFAPWDDRSTLDQLDRLVRRADQLPLLQYCLNRLWVRAGNESRGEHILLRLTDYERIGGLGGALNAHGDEILAALGEGRRAVTGAVFRQLTAGSTVAEGVRRPTRFGELIAVCGGDEPSVRAVVDAFRSPGCNFLSPELDPKNPEPIRAETFVDITHESLIRQWKKMSEWLAREVRAGRQWRRLKDRFEDGQPMIGAELANILAWRDEQKPNAIWARRYGGDFEAMINFIEKSVKWRRRFAPLMLPVFGFTALILIAIFIYGLTALTFGVPDSWPWPFNLGLLSATIATTCAFGLWRYTGLELGRAALASVTICVLVYAGGAALIAPLIWHNFTESAATNLWSVALLAPCTFFGMAIFERTFRSVFVWIWLTVSLVVPDGFFELISTTGNLKDIITITILMSWFAAIGYQIRLGSEPFENVLRRRTFALLELPALGLATYFMSVRLAKAIIQIIYGSADQPWWWLVNFGLLSGSTAITFAFGLWRYSGLQRRRALLAGGSLFLLEVAAGAALMEILFSHDVTLRHAFHWWAATLYAPCALTAMAIFEQVFRRVLVWLLLSFLFAGPYGLLIWAYDSSSISISDNVLSFSIFIIMSVWFAAVGYQLRRNPGRLRLEEDSAPASRPAMREAAVYPS
jgi:hypothetical protein